LEWQALWYWGGSDTEFSRHEWRSRRGRAIRLSGAGTGARFHPGLVSASTAARELQGDIEFDLRAVDWEQHGHDQNPSHDSVILHVFLHQPGARFFTQTSNHRNILQIHIKRDLLPNRVIFASGNCRRLGRTPSKTPTRPAQIDEILETAARVRIQRKAEQLQPAMRIHGLDEALFQAITIALGYKSNKVPFLIIAQRTSLKLLGQRTDSIEATLFDLSVFLEVRHQAERRPRGSRRVPAKSLETMVAISRGTASSYPFIRHLPSLPIKYHGCSSGDYTCQ
jgi:hypothetical protein